MLVHDLHLYDKICQIMSILSTTRIDNKGINLLQQSMVSGIIYVSMHDRKLELINP